MILTATTPLAYLDSLPPDRRQALEAVRATILSHLPQGYEEAMDYGMIVYQVPLAVYPDTYNKRPLMYAALASQKNHMAVYLCNANGLPSLTEELAKGFKAAGKKLDIGKSCVRFKKLQDLPLAVIGKVVAATPMKEFVDFSRSHHGKKK